MDMVVAGAASMGAEMENAPTTPARTTSLTLKNSDAIIARTLGILHPIVDPRKKYDRAHLAEKYDDDEPALLMAKTCELSIRTKMPEEIMLNEDKVKPSLGVQNDDGHGMWYLNTGASNHMTGTMDVGPGFPNPEFSVKHCTIP